MRTLVESSKGDFCRNFEEAFNTYQQHFSFSAIYASIDLSQFDAATPFVIVLLFLKSWQHEDWNKVNCDELKCLHMKCHFIILLVSGSIQRVRLPYNQLLLYTESQCLITDGNERKLTQLFKGRLKDTYLVHEIAKKKAIKLS